MRQRWREWLLVSPCLVLVLGAGTARASDEARETGRLLLILFDMGRQTVGANQVLINDKSRGSKGFTSERFESELRERFQGRLGINLAALEGAQIPPLAKTLLPQLVKASKSVVDDAQMVINMEGVAYKGFSPAVFGTAAAARFRSYTNVYLRQTALRPRNARNTPDEYEVVMMTTLADPAHSREADQILAEDVESGKAVRLVMPLYYEKACLACHGEPKGGRDISGYLKEGGKEGELGGILSVKIERP